MKKPDLVEITWDDSYGAGGWHDTDDLKQFIGQSHIIRTAGYIVHRSSKKIVVAGNWSRHGGAPYGHLMSIPASQIRKIREL